MEISDQEKLLLETAKILDNLKIDYFITGGFAVSVWGRPRATFDIDIVVKMLEPQVNQLVSAWRMMYDAGYADANMAREAIQQGGEFNFIDPNTGIKVDFWSKKESPNSPREFERKKTKKISEQKIHFISPEDLILSKLQWYKLSPLEKHMEDIESILKISGDILDKEYLAHWIEKLKLEKLPEIDNL